MMDCDCQSEEKYTREEMLDKIRSYKFSIIEFNNSFFETSLIFRCFIFSIINSLNYADILYDNRVKRIKSLQARLHVGEILYDPNIKDI